MVTSVSPVESGPAAVNEFIAKLRGTSIPPGDDAYDDARAVRNGLIDRRPAIIVRASGVADVVDAVTFAREHGLLLSIRGGGHNVAGNAVNDGGLVIDLSAMRAVHVDPAARTARVQGGATWADLDRETQLFGLATPGGVVSSTGVGGLTLHGWLGHLRRKHGLSIDNVLSAMSSLRTARCFAPAQPKTLTFSGRFAARAATSELSSPLNSASTQSAQSSRSAVPSTTRPKTARRSTAPGGISPRTLRMKSTRSSCHGASQQRTFSTRAPQPADLGHSRCLRRSRRRWRTRDGAATRDRDARARPLRSHSLHCAAGRFISFFPAGLLYYWKSTYIDELSDAAIDEMLQRHATRPSPLTDGIVWHLGGAIARVGETETAFGRRSAPYLFTAESTWTNRADNDRNIAWARDSLTAVQPFSQGGSYLNFPGFGEEKEAQLRAAYGPNYDRLVELKRQYDPGNLFRMNLNIRPS